MVSGRSGYLFFGLIQGVIARTRGIANVVKKQKYMLTLALKAYAESKLKVKKGSEESVYRKALANAIIANTLTPADFAKMAKPKKKKAADDDDDEPAPTPKKKAAAPAPALDQDAIKKAVRAELKKFGAATADATPTPAMLFGKAGGVRIKSAAEQYSANTTAATYPGRMRKDGGGANHPFAGQPAQFMGRTLDRPSDLGKAVSAAWVKWCINSQHGPGGIPQNMRLTDHDKDLVGYAMRHMAWSGYIGGSEGKEKVNRKKLTEFQVKGLLDDTASGGIEATPIVFDDAIVMIPVLYGEIFPFVNVTNVPRGRRMKGAAMQNPSFVSGNAEGTAIQPFNTASFVSAFDTPIHVATGAMEIGLDFEEDSPVDMGGAVIEKYGEKALEWLDRVCAVGNGYNEPLGILNTLGLTAIPTDFGASGPPTVSDYEALFFGMAKQWRNEAGAVCAYIGNDTSYRRARAIQVGSGDERRVFGMDESDYTLLGRPYKVQNDITNAKVAFVNLKRYRMYRRLGLTVRVETAGRQLALNNTKLLVLRMRYGGQLENAGAISVNVDAQS